MLLAVDLDPIAERCIAYADLTCYSRDSPGVLHDLANGHLLSVSVMPTVSLGVIPIGIGRSAMWSTEAFFMFDEEEVPTCSCAVSSGHECDQAERYWRWLCLS